MPTFSKANDKTAITAISVKILFFWMKSIMHINNLFIKFLYKIINNKFIITITMAPIYIGDLLPSIASPKKFIDKYDKGLKKGNVIKNLLA